MPLSSSEAAEAATMAAYTDADFANDLHRNNLTAAFNGMGVLASAAGRIAGETDTAIDLLATNYPGATDIAAANLQMPAFNMFEDSGRLIDTPTSSITVGAFGVPAFLTGFNGASAWTSAGQFDHGGTQPGAVSSLLSHAGDTRNTGPEFYVGQITAGTGTSLPVTDGGTTYYLMTVNGSTMLPYLCTFGAFIRVFSGGLYIGNSHEQDGVEFSASALPLGVWRYVRIKKTAALGFDNAFPNLRATPNSVIQIALPSLIPGHFSEVDRTRVLPVPYSGAYA